MGPEGSPANGETETRPALSFPQFGGHGQVEEPPQQELFAVSETGDHLEDQSQECQRRIHGQSEPEIPQFPAQCHPDAQWHSPWNSTWDSTWNAQNVSCHWRTRPVPTEHLVFHGE